MSRRVSNPDLSPSGDRRKDKKGKPDLKAKDAKAKGKEVKLIKMDNESIWSFIPLLIAAPSALPESTLTRQHSTLEYV
jgi:hypothetical protein